MRTRHAVVSSRLRTRLAPRSPGRMSRRGLQSLVAQLAYDGRLPDNAREIAEEIGFLTPRREGRATFVLQG